MKKVLLGTSALIAAAAVSAPAMAQEQIQLGIGGKMEQYFAVTSMDEAQGENRNSVGITTDTEVYFTGATTLDNGLTVGAVIQLEAEVNAPGTDEQYAYIEGAFGRIEAGERNGASSLLAHIAPAVGLAQGDVDDWTRNYNQFGNTSAVDTTSSADVPVVTYITPTLAGFSAGVSYQPGGGNVAHLNVDEDAISNNRWQAAIAYNGEFSGVGIGADVSYITEDMSNAFTAKNPTLEDSMEVWRGGLVVSYAGFSFGGSYLDRQTSGAVGATTTTTTDREDTIWDVGAAYETGPYGVSLTYADVNREDDTAAGTVYEADYQQISLHGSYTMGPGINLVGAAFWAQAEDDDQTVGTTDIDADGTGAIVGLALSF